MLSAALAVAVVASLGLGLGLAITLAHPAPHRSAATVGSSAADPHRLMPNGSTAGPGTTLTIPPLSGIMRTVTVTDTVTGAVLPGELSGDTTTWHSTTRLVAGRAYRVTMASTRSDGVVTVTDKTFIAGPG